MKNSDVLIQDRSRLTQMSRQDDDAARDYMATAPRHGTFPELERRVKKALSTYTDLRVFDTELLGTFMGEAEADERRIKELEALLANVNTMVENLRVELKASKEESTRLFTLFMGECGKIDGARANVKALTAERDALKTEVYNLKVWKMNHAGDEVAALKSTLAAYENTLAERNRTVNALRAELLASQGQVAAWKNKADSLENALGLARENNAKHSQVEASNQALRKENANCAERNMKLRKQHDMDEYVADCLAQALMEVTGHDAVEVYDDGTVIAFDK